MISLYTLPYYKQNANSTQMQKDENCEAIRIIPDGSYLEVKNSLKNTLLSLNLIQYDFLQNKDFQCLFKINNSINKQVVDLIEVPEVSSKAIFLASYFGQRNDLAYIINKASTKSNLLSTENQLFLIGILIDPKSDKEWDFIEKSLYETSKDSFLTNIPSQSLLVLSVNQDLKSLAILRKALHESPNHFEAGIYEDIKLLIKQKENTANVMAVSSSILEESIASISELLILNTHGGTFHLDNVILDNNKEKAIISCSVHKGTLSGTGYNILFQRENNQWCIKGIWYSWVT